VAKKKDENGNGSMLEFPCTYKNLNVGDKTCRLGVGVAKLRRPGDDGLTLAQVDGQLLGMRLTGKLIAKAQQDSHPDQGSLEGMESDYEIEASVDVGGFSVKEDSLSLGFTFMRKSVDVAQLAEFAKKPGRVIISGIEEIPEDQKAAATSGDSEDE